VSPGFKILITLEQERLLSRWQSWRRRPGDLCLGLCLLSALLWGLFYTFSAQTEQGRPIWVYSTILLFLTARQFYPFARSAYAQNLLTGPFFILISRPHYRLLWFSLRTSLMCLPVLLILLGLQFVLAPRDLLPLGLGALFAMWAGMVSAMPPALFSRAGSTGANRIPFRALAPLWCRLRHNRLLIPTVLLLPATPVATHLALSNNPEPGPGLAVFGIGIGLQALLLCPVSPELSQFMRLQPGSFARTLRQVSLAPIGLWLGLSLFTLLISGAPLKEGFLIVMSALAATGLLILWTCLTRFSHKPAAANWVLGIDLTVAAFLAFLALPAALLWLILRLIMLVRRVRSERWRCSQP